MSLEQEKQIYRLHLIDLLGPDDSNEGKFAVIKEADIQGPFDTYELALTYAYETHGLGPFLVKKIERNATALFFSRNIV